MLRLGIGAHATLGCMRSTQRTSRFSRRRFLRFQAFCVRNAMDLYQECEMAYRTVSRFVGTGWRWVKLWIGSCFPARSPNKDEIAA